MKDVVAGVPRAGRTWLWRLAGVAVSILALSIVLVSVDVRSAFEVLGRAEPAMLAAVLGVLAIQLAIRAKRWTILLPHRPDGHPVTVRRAIAPLLVGYLGNAVLPARLGEPIRALLVARREQLDGLAAFGATMLERLVDTTMLALIGLIAALLLGVAGWVAGVAALAGLGGIAALALLVLVGVVRLADAGARLLVAIGFGARTQRIQAWAHSFAAGIDRGRDVPRLLVVVLLSAAAWVLDATIFLLVGWALGIELGLAEAVLIGAVAVLSTAIPAAPGYVGTFELAATATAVALGVPEPEALAMAVLVHVITVLPIALAGALAALRIGGGLSRLATDAGAASSRRMPSAGEAGATFT